MNNGEVCEYVRTMPLYKGKYISDLCVDEGYGQSCGGYLTSYNKNPKAEKPTQKEHFLNYYGSEINAKKLPSYHYLRSPQLLLFIAEIAGLSNKKINNAYELIRKYEEDRELKSREKNGNYLWGKPEFRVFKNELCISSIVRIIKDSKNWDEVMERTRKL